jgi:long-chain acyl-CoA synthetase
MSTLSHYTLPVLLQDTVNQHATRPAVAFLNDEPFTYAEFGKRVRALMAFMELLGVKKGDRIGILSANAPHWGMVYFAIVSMGAIAVPLLPDFSGEEIKNTLRHSGAKAIFVSKGLLSKLEKQSSRALKYKIRIEDFALIGGDKPDAVFNENKTPVHEYPVEEDDLAVIIYTSGTTGKSKGVMLSHKNIVFDVVQAGTIQEINETDRFLSVLPLSHTYENSIGFILPLYHGACVYYIQKVPSPTVLINAFQKVKPTLMLTVPLIIEKIYRAKILPAFTEKKMMKYLYSKPFFRKLLNRMAGKKLLKTFGGELKFFGIGGAKLNEEVEKFLIEAKFPYAVGYGLTETAPLIAGFGVKEARLQSAGKPLEGVDLKLYRPDKNTGEGEIWAKGPNVMKGYYKEPELTKEVLTEDGWFRTGDLGVFDEDGYLFIRGRSKNVIIGPSGENIYPEEIESVINNFKHVVESVVVEQKGKLVAMVHFDRDEIEKKFEGTREDVSEFVEKTCQDIRDELQSYINKRVNKFSRISKIIPHPEEFVKTATKKIKRFLYNENKNDHAVQ